DHTLTLTSTMYPRQVPNDSISRTLSACDISIVKAIYRDNFGPSVIDSFIVISDLPGTATCRWRVREETGCRPYTLKRMLQDGTTWVVSDSVACLGAGSAHTVVDSAAAPGLTSYILSVVDSIGPGLWQERALNEQSVDIVGASPAARMREPQQQFVAAAVE